MDKQTKVNLINHLAKCISEHKLNGIERVLPWRTRYVTVVLENTYYSQNTSAVIRTCECFGIQDFHVIENYNSFKMNSGVTHGAANWVDIYRYNQEEQDNSQLCLKKLKQQNYQVVATTLADTAVIPSQITIDNKLAFVFGNEREGVSDTIINNADILMKVPMYGFTQSFNISVSAALIVSSFIERLHQSQINWQLSEDEKLDLKLQWHKQILRHYGTGEKLQQQFLS